MAKAAKTRSATVTKKGASKKAPSKATPAGKKPAATKTPTKKPAAKKPATKKPAAKKPAAKKPAAKKPAAKKPAAKKPAAKKPAAKKLAMPVAKPPAAPRKAASPAPAVTTPATIDAFKPFVLLGPSEDSDRWQLFLADAASPVELFESEGRSGNGYAWDSVARVAMRAFPEHEDAIELGSEAGTFVAMSEQKAPLIALGAALLRLLENHAELRTVIRSVPEDDWDD